MPKKKSPPITEAWRGITFTRRALVVGGAQAAVGVALAARMAYISVVDNDRYVLESESNRVNLTLVPPRRGWIVDRSGKALANNRVSLRIDIIPDRLHNKELVLGQLQTLLRLDGDTMERINRDLKAASGFQPVAIKEDMTEAEYSSILVRLPELPGIAPQRGFARNYPTGAAVGHLIGYVGAPNAEEYQKAKDPLYITPGYKIGKDGLEKYFQDMLKGQPGARRVEVTARGKVVRDLSTQPDVQGKTVHLTIDADLQEFVARRMGRESGAAVVIDCQNGDILSFVSMPSFDPNSFSDGISSSEYAWLRADDHQPLINKATRGLYPPGSTLKPMAAIAAVEHGVDPSERHTCVGGYRLGSRFFRCLGTHGSLDMPSAIMKSCNSYFYWLAHRLGYDAMAPTARLLGLGEEYQLAGSNQRFGTIPDSAWKMKKYDQEWSASDSLNAVIGQGYVLANPLQLAVMAARIASGRRLYPRLINREFKNEPLPFSPEALAVARQGMDLVVNGAGTAVRSRLPLDGITMAGKTGTAQVRGLGTGNGKSGTWKFRDHGLFIGFAPVVNPRYATAVVIEHGMGGSRAAAPVAKDFMTFLFDREKAMEALETFEAGWGGTIKERMDRDYAAWKAGASKPDPELAQ
ncbi:MAG: penicillin-binding protein 2 [Sphingopyxis sp.]|jgi:penicillin-binding protein 2|uniref:penicillin-binding protein 2 n=1 Tax=unclassified Sphingopyxis TaxID=2614943 RepID=UPI0007311DBD|nr:MULTISPECIES: penicillin-binding protein 2 [unclassified Sphingopyxis]KTD99447.1 penicillin-binding protein 2 [Sphingopyxis sp. H012]KTE04018.1 penicillin-binding protein 2 [Sphingopyxis sp. H093]KTE09677.1 penicillin-binding protein 2 [Sphingopyxis sp. H053]KTE18491.1 penicillin-binding protein 2 [Sphingopyxis sp. H080]KTE30074.1 penicillin-binding protein 2 [Sphingopyxis sp. H038]